MPPIVTTRPITADERALLSQRPAKLFGWWTGIVSAACIFALIFLVGSLFAPLFPFAIVVRGATMAATLSSVAWYVWVQRRARRAVGAQTERVDREAAAGYVRATLYTITDAVAIEEHEDEGPSYYLLLDDGHTLVLTGQYLREAADNGFPWESFEVVKVASGSWVVRVVPRGRRLTPRRTRRPFTDHEYSSGDIPADGTIEKRDFDALKGPAVVG